MNRRVVVADTSVLVAAFYRDSFSRQAIRVLEAIERQRVTAFAPHALVVEFLSVSYAKASRREGSARVDPEEVRQQVERFFEATRSINFIRETELQAEAWRLMNEVGISPPDSWMLACAISVPEAELWISHDHKDGFVEVARRNHRNVFTLTSNSASLP